MGPLATTTTMMMGGWSHPDPGASGRETETGYTKPRSNAPPMGGQPPLHPWGLRGPRNEGPTRLAAGSLPPLRREDRHWQARGWRPHDTSYPRREEGTAGAEMGPWAGRGAEGSSLIQSFLREE